MFDDSQSCGKMDMTVLAATEQEEEPQIPQPQYGAVPPQPDQHVQPPEPAPCVCAYVGRAGFPAVR